MKKGVDFIGVCVVFFCHDGKGNMVLGKRGANSRDEQGTWDPGGGSIELHDTVDETLRKEIKEEYNCEVINYEFLGFRDVHRFHNEQKTHWIALDFKVLADVSQIKNNEPHKLDEVKLFKIGEFPEPMHSQWKIFWEKYSDKLLK